ncbi:uncharacterized protein si:ch211-218d20.15 [Anguilla anguilla]|uniref:Uncharacterized protein n=1 Tax=Anguilla anguilla TaxID=7936 RepID=A0A9D3RJZ8_ANGAN|nr:uncharacterized protein si:ch211-218d20.15 [Anguilla anguilla]KAG5833324.1 hypothetical protein ANANG_G00274730 [Anguilla anguilla]
MAAVSVTEPLCEPCGYDAKFKVEVYVKKPLMPIHLSSIQVGMEMLCLCSQLDLLIRAQVHQFQEQLKQDSSPVESDSFQRQGAEIIDRMYLCLDHLPKPLPQLEDYLDAVGLSTMFPRVEVYLIHGSPVDMLENPTMDDYFPHIGKLNQLLVLSQQLEDDVRHLGSHKYIAHQLAVVYQVLSSFRGILPLSILKRDIEANFKQLKMSLVTEEGSKVEPQLPAYYVSWLLGITHRVISSVSSLPEELTEPLSPPMAFISSLT